MSSYYSTAELEEMRKKRIMNELSSNIQKLKEQLMANHDNTSQVTRGKNISLKIMATDDGVGGYSSADSGWIQSVSNKSFVKKDCEALDFSDLLISNEKKPTKLEVELNFWINSIEERIVVSEKDEKDRARVIAEVSKILEEKDTDIEDKIKKVKMRVSAFLNGSTEITDADRERIESNYYEYCAMCQMIGVKPVEYTPYMVEKEMAKMRFSLEKHRQDEYIINVIEEIMDELGCHVKDEAVLDHVAGQMFTVDGHSLCEVFVGNDGSGIMFEPIGERKSSSLDKKRQIENSANSICALYKELEERAAERGVILNRVYLDPVNVDKMCTQDDISERRSSSRKRKTAKPRQRALGSEE